MEWSDELRSYMNRYVEVCARVLRLGHWDIKVSEDESVDDDGEPIWAEIEVKKSRFAAEMKVGGLFWDGTPEEKRQTIAHELIHCHTTPICWMVERVFKDDVPHSQWDSKSGVVDHQHEVVTDELAWVVAPLLPKWDFVESEE